MALGLNDVTVLFVLPPEKFNEDQFKTISRVLSNEGAHLEIASTSLDPISGVEGLSLIPDRLVSEADPKKYRAIVMIDGQDLSGLLSSQELFKMLNKAFSLDTVQVIAAISHTSLILDRADLLSERGIAVDQDLSSNFNSNPSILDKKIVKDGKLLTAKDSESSLIVGERIKEFLLDQIQN